MRGLGGGRRLLLGDLWFARVEKKDPDIGLPVWLGFTRRRQELRLRLHTRRWACVGHGYVVPKSVNKYCVSPRLIGLPALSPAARPTLPAAKGSTSMPGGRNPRSWENESRRPEGAKRSRGTTWSFSSASMVARESSQAESRSCR